MRWLAIGAAALILAVGTAVVLVRRSGHGDKAAYIAAAERYQQGVFKLTLFDSTGNETGTGSGFLVDSSGFAITAFHVLRGAFNARAEMEGGRLFDAVSVVAWDSLADVVLFELGRAGPEGVMHPRARAYPEIVGIGSVEIGAPAVAIGAPEGIQSTISDGIVSATRRVGGVDCIQITTPTSHGSSGGPVFDAKGRVLGIVRGRFDQDAAQNLNFISPLDVVTTMLASDNRTALADFAAQTIEAPDEPEETYADRLMRIANEEFDSERYANALELFQRVAREEPDNIIAQVGVAMCLKELGRRREALALYRKALALTPDDHPIRDVLLQEIKDLEILMGLPQK